MFKKFGSVLLSVMLICVFLCSCVGEVPKDIKATVNGEQISANEIIEETGNDPMAFYNAYAEKKVEITRTIESIKELYTTILSREVRVYEVLLKEGWLVQMIIEDHPEITDMHVGDKVAIRSRISVYDSINDCIVMEDISISGTGNNSKYSDNSTIIKY